MTRSVSRSLMSGKMIGVTSVPLSTSFLGSQPVRRFVSAKEPDHIPPGGVVLSGKNDVGADRGSVGVGGEQEGAVVKCRPRWPNGCNKEGGWNMGEDESFLPKTPDTTLTNLSC